MATKDISQFHGTVEKCKICTNADGEHMDCKNCFCRGYVAQCTLCGGKGQVCIPVAGASDGTMNSTCSACGGRGVFGVRKPADWKEPEPEVKVESKEEKKELATA